MTRRVADAEEQIATKVYTPLKTYKCIVVQVVIVHSYVHPILIRLLLSLLSLVMSAVLRRRK